METEVQKKLLESVDEVKQWLETGKDFVLEQAPLVVQEVLAWGVASATFFVILNLVLFLLGLCLTRMLYLKMWFFEKNIEDSGPEVIFIFVGNIVALLVPFINICIYTYQLTYISYAPRLYILQQISKLLN